MIFQICYYDCHPETLEVMTHHNGVQVKPWVFATKPVPECPTCSNHLFSCQHPHISNLEKLSSPVRSEANILLGSSTLHNVWRFFKGGVPGFHYDVIIGGKIHDTHYSYIVSTARWEGRANIVIAAGNNNADFAYNDSFSSITTQLESLVRTLLRQNQRHRIVIATLLYAPKYCDPGLPRDRNMTEKVRSVNKWITNLNNIMTGLQFDISKYGVMGDPQSGPVVQHNYQYWREPQVNRKLHLVDSVKQEMARELMNLYREMNHL